MKLIGFNFTRINIERLEGPSKNLSVNTTIDISSIEKTNVNFLKGKEELVNVKFKYNINYEPKFAKLEFEGNMIIALDAKQSKDLLKKWKKKETPEDIRVFIFNIIMRKSSIKALQLEDDLNLPLHIPMPRVSRQNQDNK